MHPVFQEMARVPRGDVSIRGEVFGRWLHALVHDVQPQLDDYAVLRAEVITLRKENDALTAKRAKAGA